MDTFSGNLLEDVVHQNERKKKKNKKQEDMWSWKQTIQHRWDMKRIPEMMMEGHPRVTDGLAAGLASNQLRQGQEDRRA